MAKDSQFMTIEGQLSRTIALFEVDFAISDREAILRALTSPRIAIVASDAVAHSFAGQTAITTAAMLMARSGHQVFVDTPDATLVGHQPPFTGGSLHHALTDVGSKLIDGVPIHIGPPIGSADIVFYLGTDLPWMVSPAARYISVGASDWEASISEHPMRQLWSAFDWPMGALAAAVLMAAEAIKVTARMLLPLSPHRGHLRGMFEERPTATLELAPRYTPLVRELGGLDTISAGAVSNGAVYALYRIPGVRADLRTFDGDISDGSNLNRNALLISTFLALAKVELFKVFAPPGVHVEPIDENYPLDGSVRLTNRVLVGVDDVPARWAAARAGTLWMGVGATDHFNSMASVHHGHSACAACLHPRNETLPGPTPTIAFVSFLAGLLVASDLLRELADSEVSLVSRQRFLTALNPSAECRWPVPVNPDCPVQCPASALHM